MLTDLCCPRTANQTQILFVSMYFHIPFPQSLLFENEYIIQNYETQEEKRTAVSESLKNIVKGVYILNNV